MFTAAGSMGKTAQVSSTIESMSEGFQAQLPCEPESVARARAAAAAWCSDAGTACDVVADVELAVSEAATNAVRHSDCSEFDMHGWVDGRRVVVSVSDRGLPRPTASPGLGLGWQIIRRVARSVDIEDTHPGTRVTMWFDRRRSADRAPAQ